MMPQHAGWNPDSGHLGWHGREVFQGAARHTG
jgi:hypothetical protein